MPLDVGTLTTLLQLMAQSQPPQRQPSLLASVPSYEMYQPYPTPQPRRDMERMQPAAQGDWETILDVLSKPTWYSDPDMPRIYEMYSPEQYLRPEQYDRMEEWYRGGYLPGLIG